MSAIGYLLELVFVGFLGKLMWEEWEKLKSGSEDVNDPVTGYEKAWEMKVRKRWFILFGFYVLTYLTNLPGMFVTLENVLAFNPIPYFPWYLLFQGALFYYAFRKRGTSFLLVKLVFAVLFLGILIVAIPSALKTVDQMPLTIFNIIFSIASLSLYLYYIYCGFQLYKVNLYRRKVADEANFTNKCAEQIAGMENALNQEHLENAYIQIVRTWPKWEKRARSIYQKKKWFLENNQA